MTNYKSINNWTGWIVWLIASVVYLLTIEPSTSLWDCGEFITSAYKLEVGHPPGAPIFMLMGRFFTLFTPSPAYAAAMVNAMSALVSSFTILFLFWTITHFAQKLVIKNETTNHNTNNHLLIMGAGIVGALAYTFTDSFWFSAVEGEVYASSSFFTAITFWCIIRWRNVQDQVQASRWLILIAYLIGLAIGVHLLNLLVIPAITMVYYFNKFKVSPINTLIALGISFFILGFIQWGLIPWIPRLASWFELLAVNSLGLPYHSGVLFFTLLISGGLIYGLYYTQKHQKVLMNHIMLFLTFIVMAYYSFALIVIRSEANPPMDQNNPDNIFALRSYLNRDQYGDRPLVHGYYFNIANIMPTSYEDGRPFYAALDGKYVITHHKPEIEYPDGFASVFPRMHSYREDHIKAYQSIVDIEGRPVQGRGRNGEEKTEQVPTMGENLNFFFRYQVYHMYFRYFMWNFSGRQNDNQGFYGDIINGNWITGIPFIDKKIAGYNEKLPDHFRNDPTRNKYYMLPFLLGLAGLYFQLKRSRRDFSVTLLLFFMTGLAIIIYLNQPPVEPRERDYTYVGSFYAFAIWIGLGVLAVTQWLQRFLSKRFSIVLASALSFLLVPGIMAKENWRDHDRSGRYTARDLAYNYLNSCAPNAILFTNGDNDTFPLWYLQEVEGVRTDVRVMNLMLLNTDWHIRQARYKAYESDPLPISIDPEKYMEGNNSRVELIERTNRHIPIKELIHFFNSDEKRSKQPVGRNRMVDYIPSRLFTLPVDSAYVVDNGVVQPEDASLVVDEISWKYPGSFMSKAQLCLLDILANNDWERPIYFVSPGNSNTLGLDKYLQLEGYAYRLVPIESESKRHYDAGRINSDLLFDNMMNKMKWGRMYEDDVHLSHFDLRTLRVVGLRNIFNRLAEQLVTENKLDSAGLVLDEAMRIMPTHKVPYDHFVLSTIELYYQAEKTEKANELALDMAEKTNEELQYFLALRKTYPGAAEQEMNIAGHILTSLRQITGHHGQNDLSQQINAFVQPLSRRQPTPSSLQ